jgi:hypothetical protein
VRLDQLPWHDLTPEQGEQDDDRNRNAQ